MWSSYNWDYSYGLQSLPFYGRNYSYLCYNGFGLFSFDTCYWQGYYQSPKEFPLNDTTPMIAGFWTNTFYITNNNFRNGSQNQIFYRQPYYRIDHSTRSLVSTYLQRHLLEEEPFTPTFFTCATWNRVSTNINRTNVSNTYQIAYTTDGIRSFVFLLYNHLEWSHASNNFYAQAGLNAGNGVSHVRLPYTGTSNITRLSSASNVGVPGLFIFRTDQIPASERCGSRHLIRTSPQYGTMFGSTPVFIQGPCFANVSSNLLRCRFGSNNIVNGIVINEFEAMCLTPPSLSQGTVPVYISLDNGLTFTQSYHNFFYTSPILFNFGYNVMYGEISVINKATPIINPGERLSMYWYLPYSIQSRLPRNSRISLTLQMTTITFDNARNHLSLNLYTTIQTHIPLSSYFQSIVVPSVNSELPAVVFRIQARDNVTGTIYGAIHSTIFVLNTSRSHASNFCRNWMRTEPAASTWNQDLMMCPLTLNQANGAGCCYWVDWSCTNRWGWFSNPGNCAFRQGRLQEQETSAVACYQSWRSNRWGARSECCYNIQGQLITRGRGAGTDDRYHSSIEPIRHFLLDFLPQVACCHLSSERDTCDGYISLRPPRPGGNVGFTWGGGWGDPHYFTLDGSSYTFNGYGEYTYLAIANNIPSSHAYNPSNQSFSFISQVRTTPRILSNGSIVGQATITRGFAAKSDHPQAEKVSIIVSKNQSIIVHRGNQIVNFNSSSDNITEQNLVQTLTYPEMIIERNRTSEVIRLSWYIGTSVIITPITISSIETTRLLNIEISIDESMKNRTFGLLGPYDDSKSNDMRAANGTIIGLAESLSLDVIHRDFGLSWAIDPAQSLFHYEDGDSANFYTTQNTNFVPIFSPAPMTAAQESAAHSACTISSSNQSLWTVAQRACYYDVSVTNDTGFGRSSLIAANTIVENINSQRNPPLFNSNLPIIIFASLSDLIKLNFTATSQYGTSIIYTLVQGPAAATFHNQTGAFEWRIPGSIVNDTLITVSAEDNQYHLVSTREVFIRIIKSINPTVPTSVSSSYSIVDCLMKTWLVVLMIWFRDRIIY